VVTRLDRDGRTLIQVGRVDAASWKGKDPASTTARESLRRRAPGMELGPVTLALQTDLADHWARARPGHVESGGGSMDDAGLQQLIDEKAIVEVMNAYTRALDTKNWELLESTMAPDGTADFGDLAGVGTLDSPQALVELCRRSFRNLRATQHLQGNYVVKIDGESAKASCNIQASHFQEGLPGGETFFVFARYQDRFVRTPEGWRIKHRRLETISATGNTNMFAESVASADSPEV